MEPKVRGNLEKLIDELTRPRLLEGLVLLFQTKYPHESLTDCVFGFIVGAVATRNGDLTGMKINYIDAREIWDMVDRRTIEIREKISLIVNK